MVSCCEFFHQRERNINIYFGHQNVCKTAFHSLKSIMCWKEDIAYWLLFSTFKIQSKTNGEFIFKATSSLKLGQSGAAGAILITFSETCYVYLQVADHCIGGSRGGVRDARPPPWASKFFRFHAVFGKIWRVHAPPGGFTPPPRENPGSATALYLKITGH